MIFLFAALDAEAAPLISSLSLNRDREETVFPTYRNASFTLTVTGVGQAAAAAAVSRTLTKEAPGTDDFLVNIGSCASIPAGDAGRFFMVHQIIGSESGRRFYPDILRKHPFAEATLVSGDRPLTADFQPPVLRNLLSELTGSHSEDILTITDPATKDPSGTKMPPLLYDMEACGVFIAARPYFSCDRIIFLKCVTDSGNGDFKALSASIQNNFTAGPVLPFLRRLAESESPAIDGAGSHAPESDTAPRTAVPADTDGQAPAAADLTRVFRCSESMRLELENLLTYADAAGIDADQLISDLYEAQLLPAKSRKEGKTALAALKENILREVT